MKTAVASLPWRRLARAAAVSSSPPCADVSGGLHRPLGHRLFGIPALSPTRPSVAAGCRRSKSSSHTGDHEYPGPHHPTHRFGPLAEPLPLPRPHPHAHPHPSRRDTGPRPEPPEPLPPPPRDLSPELLPYAKAGFRSGAGTTGAGAGGDAGGRGGLTARTASGVVTVGFNRTASGDGGGGVGVRAYASRAYSGGGGSGHEERGWEGERAAAPEEDPGSPQVLSDRAVPPGARVSSGPLRPRQREEEDQQRQQQQQGNQQRQRRSGGGGGEDIEDADVVPPLAS